ncbi:short-chain dehydrogenase [Acidocella aquatica]|uniref:Short-chain dehydrogenase n=1 Tax=Acidocella aquatica TaxID=1922313 RepID=A0ABQ5ZYZ5_9PROT|nr:SDR family NAD(P)-dependent oxidoreductase [Acidocella aquatica]GLR65440.1 short-chain dehydrogenase [Acidocella aquatica]
MNQGFERTVVVVGAAGGIGLEIVRQLQGQARVLAVVQNAEQQAIVSSLCAQSFTCDLLDTDSVAAAAAQVAQLVPGPLDAVVFCAAMQPVSPVELIKRVDIERLFAINVFSTMQFVQGMIPALRRKPGRIVLFSSMAGRVAAPMLGAYSASKHALEGLADTLRLELRTSGITVSLIEPGGVNTPMAAAQPALVDQALAALSETDAAHYGPLLRGYKTLAAKALRFASRPGDVARVAVRAAIGPKRPKARYAAGMDAKLTVALGHWLPASWLDALLVKMTLGS